MDWANERYVRLYTRETIADIALSWEARAIWHEIIKKLDRAGVIPLAGGGFRGLAGLIRIPYEVVEEHLGELLDDGRIEYNEEREELVAPNFVEAQEAAQSDKQRQAESRARRRDRARKKTVTNRDRGSDEGQVDQESTPASTSTSTPVSSVTEVTNRDSGVTECDKSSRNQSKTSRPVTSCHSVPSLAVPSQTDLDLSVDVDLSGPRGHNGFDLEAIYRLYPRKRGKKDGMSKLSDKVTADHGVYLLVMAAVEQMAAAWKGHDTHYCPMFSTFVNQEMWADGELPMPKQDRRRGAAPSSEQDWEDDKDKLGM